MKSSPDNFFIINSSVSLHNDEAEPSLRRIRAEHKFSWEMKFQLVGKLCKVAIDPKDPEKGSIMTL